MKERTQKYFETLTSEEIKAAEKVLELANLDVDQEAVLREIDNDYLTFGEMNGKEYCWYAYQEQDVCVQVDTLEEVDAEEVGLY